MSKIIDKIRQRISPYSSNEFSDDIHSKNREVLKRAYYFSILFGGITMLILWISKNFTLSRDEFLYYGYYVILGGVGLLICYTKSGKYTPGIIGILGCFTIFIVFLKVKPPTEALIFFLGFVIAYGMLLDINPFVYTSVMIFAELIIIVLFIFKLIPNQEPFYDSTMFNFIIVDVIAISISFWKRRILLKKYRTERSIEKEKQKSEDLLLNVLPKDIIEQLKFKGKADPVSYENVTVCFCEIANFQELSAVIDAETLVNELNDIFECFDRIVEQHSCVRIKTFGEIYMAVCGLPVPAPDHADNIVSCAKEFLGAVKKRNETANVKLQVKIGISSGSVIAGIVGIRKYIYDIFGDTVNTAYRMKTLCNRMEIKVSPETYSLTTKNFDFVKQQAIDVKGKGSMETYNLS